MSVWRCVSPSLVQSSGIALRIVVARSVSFHDLR